jgi:hypothetical protein
MIGILTCTKVLLYSIVSYPIPTTERAHMILDILPLPSSDKEKSHRKGGGLALTSSKHQEMEVMTCLGGF